MSPEWITACAAMWAAIATTWAAIATMQTVKATTSAPLSATRLADRLQQSGESRKLKLWIFTTVMQHRNILGEVDCVRALNTLDAIYFDVTNVRNAWANLYAALSDSRNFTPQGPSPVVEERTTHLLQAMAENLGIADDFRPDDFKRIYLSEALASELNLRHLQRQAVASALNMQATPNS